MKVVAGHHTVAEEHEEHEEHISGEEHDSSPRTATADAKEPNENKGFLSRLFS